MRALCSQRRGTALDPQTGTCQQQHIVQTYPLPPPRCVALYILINGILTAFSYVRERDSFLVTLPKLVGSIVRCTGHSWG